MAKEKDFVDYIILCHIIISPLVTCLINTCFRSLTCHPVDTCVMCTIFLNCKESAAFISACLLE